MSGARISKILFMTVELFIINEVVRIGVFGGSHGNCIFGVIVAFPDIASGMFSTGRNTKGLV